MPLLSGKVRGKLGDVVFFNRYGQQLARMRTIPTNPNSEKQQIVRDNIGKLAQLWAGKISTAQVKKVNKANWTTTTLTISLTPQQKTAFGKFQTFMKNVLTALMNNETPQGVTIET